jgi:hypothetical protein
VQIPCTQGDKPKKFTLQGASHKKKRITGEKQNLPILQFTGGKGIFTKKKEDIFLSLKIFFVLHWCIKK